MTMWFWIHAFAVEAKVFGEGMDEGSLMGRHRLEAKSLFGFVGCEDPEFSLLDLSPFDVFSEHL